MSLYNIMNHMILLLALCAATTGLTRPLLTRSEFAQRAAASLLVLGPPSPPASAAELAIGR